MDIDEESSELDVFVIPHQRIFLEDDKVRHLALVGGFGCGKTYTFCLKAIDLASKNIGYTGLLLEPTYSMVSDTLEPQLTELLDTLQIPYTSKAGRDFTLFFPDGQCQLKLRSAENHKRLRGMNVAFAGIDEIDLMTKELAAAAWKTCQSRMRLGAVFQLFTTSTPEGFNFLYDYFEKGKKSVNRRLIRGKTRDNPFLTDEYIETMLEDFPPALVDAYLNGKFVNLTAGQVYTSFDMKESHTDIDMAWVVAREKQLNKKFTLHIGQDFNVNKCYSAIHIIDGNNVYGIAELAELKNTATVITAIKDMYPDRRIIMYPDSSGKNERSNASQTDITLLKDAGFRLDYPNKNPFVRDRVGSVNAMLQNANMERRYFINTNTMPVATDSFIEQAYDKNGQPDKQHDQDHPPDAIGYFINRKFPLRHGNNKKIKLIGL